MYAIDKIYTSPTLKTFFSSSSYFYLTLEKLISNIIQKQGAALHFLI